jgi:hypothetical protein
LSKSADEGIANYRQLRARERHHAPKPGWLGGKPNAATDSHRSTSAAPKRKHLKRRNETLIAAQLQAMPTFYPMFIYLITVVQVKEACVVVTLLSIIVLPVCCL